MTFETKFDPPPTRRVCRHSLRRLDGQLSVSRVPQRATIRDMSDLPGIGPDLLDLPSLQAALAERDITRVYAILTREGIPQRTIAALTGQSQSEVCEIIKGRQVQSYDVLVRIANGLGVPRGAMGLAYDEDSSTEPVEEGVDEDVERRNFFAIAGAIMFGAPVFGDPHPLTLRDVVLRPPARVSPSDVVAFEQTIARLNVLDREAGGMAAREALAATAKTGETLLSAQATPDVHQQLRYAVSEAHRLAGWASGDVGLMNHSRWHFHCALDFAQGDPARVAAVLASAADMEKHAGDPNTALKFFQLAETGIDPGTDPQASAVLAGLSASAYLSLGHADVARRQVVRSRELFADANPADSLPFFSFYGPGHGLLAASSSKLANYDVARTDVVNALRTRPSYDVRCNALDTIVLATVALNAGETSTGIPQAQRALALVTQVGSQRARDRLTPMIQALESRPDSTSRELAVHVRRVRQASSQV
jgi:transcriptional regulator with XRE-family HTH domain